MTSRKGTLLVTHTRLASRAVNRLRRPGNGDILMPGGTVSILGTTSTRVDTLDDIQPTAAEADLLVEDAARMLPALATMRYVRAYAGVRPLPGGAGRRDRSRGLARVRAVRPRSRWPGQPGDDHRRQAHHLPADGRTRRRPGVPPPRRDAPLPDGHDAHARGCGVRGGPGPASRRATGCMRTTRTMRWLCECRKWCRAALSMPACPPDCARPARCRHVDDTGLRSRVGTGAPARAGSAPCARSPTFTSRATSKRGATADVDFFGEHGAGQRAILCGEQLARARS